VAEASEPHSIGPIWASNNLPGLDLGSDLRPAPLLAGRPASGFRTCFLHTPVGGAVVLESCQQRSAPAYGSVPPTRQITVLWWLVGRHQGQRRSPGPEADGPVSLGGRRKCGWVLWQRFATPVLIGPIQFSGTGGGLPHRLAQEWAWGASVARARLCHMTRRFRPSVRQGSFLVALRLRR